MQRPEEYEATLRAEFGVAESAPAGTQAAALLGLAVVLALGSAALAVLPPAPLIVVLVVGTLALVPRWLEVKRRADWFWFVPLKTWSIIGWMLAIQLARLGVVSTAMSALFWALMFLNILEAAAAELSMRRQINVGSYWNPPLGLGVAVLFPLSAVQVTPEGVQYALTPGWVLAYTLWNFAFVTGSTRGRLSLQHFVVLAVALAWAALDPGLWLQARVNTLGIYMVLYCSFFPTVFLRLNAPPWLRRRGAQG
ncbi:MAG: hypothetical protein H6741_27900 [Alphaproteobacteria bacterium]|nr:hypothetical protein [Alphaproteobacteria bacterium]MCB9796539.1 hypothetical protein [Alphaproteobacteria bacterium]